jgi:hypothetical protein
MRCTPVEVGVQPLVLPTTPDGNIDIGAAPDLLTLTDTSLILLS